MKRIEMVAAAIYEIEALIMGDPQFRISAEAAAPVLEALRTKHLVLMDQFEAEHANDGLMNSKRCRWSKDGRCEMSVHESADWCAREVDPDWCYLDTK